MGIKADALALVSLSLTATAKLRVDFDTPTGPVKPVNGIGQPPMLGLPVKAKLFHYLKEAGIPL